MSIPSPAVGGGQTAKDRTPMSQLTDAFGLSPSPHEVQVRPIAYGGVAGLVQGSEPVNLSSSPQTNRDMGSTVTITQQPSATKPASQALPVAFLSRALMQLILACQKDAAGGIASVESGQLDAPDMPYQVLKKEYNFPTNAGLVMKGVYNLMMFEYGARLVLWAVGKVKFADLKELIEGAKPIVESLCCADHSTKVIFRLIELLGQSGLECLEYVFNEPTTIEQLAVDEHGGEVLVLLAKTLGPERNNFIINLCAAKIKRLASVKWACSIVIRCAEHASHDALKGLALAVVAKADQLVMDRFGTNMIQYFLTPAPEGFNIRGADWLIMRIREILADNFLLATLVVSKCSAPVIDKLLRGSTPWEEMIDALCSFLPDYGDTPHTTPLLLTAVDLANDSQMKIFKGSIEIVCENLRRRGLQRVAGKLQRAVREAGKPKPTQVTM